MKALIITILGLIFLTFQACKKDPIKTSSSYDYVVFGTIYGECNGPDCITLYKIENEKLNKNSNRDYPTLNNKYQGIYTLLSSDKYNLSKDLPDFLPFDFMMQSAQFLGCPDCVDQGGYYLEISKNGVMKNWLIDKNTSNLPQELHEFIDKLAEKMELLK